MKSRTRYIYEDLNKNVIVIGAKKIYRHYEDNIIEETYFPKEFWLSIPFSCKEITYHQYIMWLCFGEPIVV